MGRCGATGFAAATISGRLDMLPRMKRALFRAVVVAAAIAAVFGVAATLGVIQSLARSNAQNSLNNTYAMDEWVTLDASRDAADTICVPFSPVESYSADFGFEGTLQVRISQAARYDDPEAAGIASTDNCLTGATLFNGDAGSIEDFDFMLVDFTVKNVDAHPTLKTFVGNKRFLASNILSLHPAVEQVYFSGVDKQDAGRKEVGYFDIAPGEERCFTVGYAIGGANGDPENDEFFMSAGAINPNKYRILLKVDDMRGQCEPLGSSVAH
ncbi:hypothetical protein [Collinsella intestinalis]|nr:hypothetical protein [Collinsella intestinalis]